jgi:hypothetical protein
MKNHLLVKCVMIEGGVVVVRERRRVPLSRVAELQLIAAVREQAVRDVNTILIDIYWEVGEIISRKIEAAELCDATVDRLAQYIARTQSFGSATN